MKTEMTYKEFRESPVSKKTYEYYILTVSQERHGEPAAVRALIAQWEPSNAKWYVPMEYEGRTACGYTNDIWFGRENGNWKIDQIRTL